MTKRSARNKSPLANLQVLVADQSPQMAGLIASALKAIGVGAAVKVTDSSAAWLALGSKKFDAAILDFNLRPKGAAELTVGLRRSDLRNALMPVIGLAASVTTEELRAAMLAGVNKVAVKPVSADTLRARLLEVIEGSIFREPQPLAVGVDESNMFEI